MPSLSPKIKILLILAKNYWKIEIKHYFIWKLEFVSVILPMIVSGNSLLFLTHFRLLQTCFFFIILITMRPLTQFQLKLTGANLQKKCEFCLTW